jgi:hypothetical protein
MHSALNRWARACPALAAGAPAVAVAFALLGALALALAGCAVNDQGLTPDPDALAQDAGGPLDAPIDQAPTIDAGPDLACGPCDAVTTFVPLPGGRFTGTTSGTSANEGSCGGDMAPERVFKIDLFAKSDLFVTTHGTAFDTVVYLRRGCCGPELACNDDADERGTSVLTARGLTAGTYYVYVDGASASDAGDFTVDIYATPAAPNDGDACGNPTRIGAADVTGSTCGFQDDYSYSPTTGCPGAVSGPNGFDQIYYFVLDQESDVTFSTCNNTCIDTVLYLRDVCSETSSQRACDDDSCRASGSCQPGGNQVQSRVSARLAAGVHYLVLDTFAAAQLACGTFTISTNGL